MTAGLGGTIAAGALLNQLRPRSGDDHPSLTGNTLAAIGGLGAAAYGLSGSNPSNIMPTVRRLFGGSPLPTTTAQPAPASPPPAAPASQLSRYINPDGSFRIHDIVKAPDQDLQAAVALLSPEQRAQMRAKLQGFQPTLGQRLGARATGIDIEQQRARFAKMLGA